MNARKLDLNEARSSFQSVLDRIAAARASNPQVESQLEAIESQIRSARELFLTNLARFNEEMSAEEADVKRLVEELRALVAARKSKASTAAAELPVSLPRAQSVDPDLWKNLCGELLSRFARPAAPEVRSSHTKGSGFSDWAMDSRASASRVHVGDPLAPLGGLVARLPPRRAVWWGCLASVHLLQIDGVSLAAEDTQSFEAAAQWAMDPGSPGALASCPTGSAGQAIAEALNAATASPVDLQALSDHVMKAVRIVYFNAVPDGQRAEAAQTLHLLLRDIAEGRRLWPEDQNRPIGDSWFSSFHSNKEE